MKNHDWKDYEKAAQKGPLAFLTKLIILVFILGALIGGLGYVFGWFSESAQVVQEEFGPRAMLKKYEEFKDIAAALDAKKASIESYEKGLADTKAMMVDRDNKALPMVEWPRDVREGYMQRQTEVRGLKASYNTLAADYNARMAKFNYRFTNVGDLPQGATTPLPREFRTYIID